MHKCVQVNFSFPSIISFSYICREWWLGRDGVFFVLLGHLLNHSYYLCDILYPFVSLLCLVTGDNNHSEFTIFLITFKKPKPIPHFSLQHYHPNFICVTTKVLEKTKRKQKRKYAFVYTLIMTLTIAWGKKKSFLVCWIMHNRLP